jgi:hypothetical protein
MRLDFENLKCDMCDKENCDQLTQHCYIGTGRILRDSDGYMRPHFLCDACMEEFPIPSDEELRAEGVIPLDDR